MLSVLCLRTGSFGRVGQLANVSKVLCVKSSTQTSAVPEKAQTSSTISKGLDNPTHTFQFDQNPTKNWQKANEIFYGPDRDLANYPHPMMQDERPPTRLIIFPKHWFDAFYEKTGVTGPYLFTFGLATWLVSKEIWVADHNISEIIGMGGACALITYCWGDKIKNWFIRKQEAVEQDSYFKPIANEVQKSNDKIAEVEDHQWRLEAESHIFEAKKENVDLQLEAQYRDRLQQAYNQVKKRLDYQLHLQTSKRAFEQRHMVDWIMDNVRKNITPQQEKESIKSCITQLKNLSAA